MILIPEVLTILILNLIFTLFSAIAFFLSIKIFLKWNINSTSTLQYTLEKQSYLTATIIKYIFIIKVPLFLFFIFTLDKISNILTGAMCGAGVVDATNYGNYLFVLKIINLYVFAYWLALHAEDMKHEDQPYTKAKFGFFIVAFFLFLAEMIIEGVMFSSIDLDEIVSCCGTIYSSSTGSYISQIFAMSPTLLLGLFYGVFTLLILFFFLKRSYTFAILNIFFILISIITLITFFGTYIYELPSHHCPFCFLQSDYYYVGYLLYTLLFTGTFYGIAAGFIPTSEENRNLNYKRSILFNSLYVILVSWYPLFYYIKNGVWL